jgi:hypothetical protein
MTASYKMLALEILAVIALAALLKSLGVAPVIILGLVGAGVLILLVVKRSQRRKTEVIFGFYVNADEILRGDDGKRYRFEIADVIKNGEMVVRMMPDPPPLSSFALGALYHSLGDHNAAVEHLGLAAEEEILRESPHVSPSRPLRRYVRRLRQIERRPQRWPKISAAISSLERMHQERAAHLLAQNQVQLKRLVEGYEAESPAQSELQPTGFKISGNRSLRSIKPPPPISQVLNDVYQEEPKTS